MSDNNQGEGNREAARRYNRKTRDYVEKADIEQDARDAEPASEAERISNIRARDKAASRARD